MTGLQNIKWPAVFLLGILCGRTLGDTIVLKDGAQLEGVVVGETATEYTVEYHVSAAITDTRQISKSDVEKIEKEPVDEKAFRELKNVTIGPNSFPSASYEQSADSLRSFLSEFPKSAHLAEVQRALDAIKAEKKRVDAGEVKIDSHWFSRDEAKKERIQLTGQAFYKYMAEQARRGDFVGAMNSFDQIEKSAGGSRSYPEAVELAKQILPPLKSAADRMLANLKYHKAERAKGMQLLSGTDLAETMAANQNEQRQADAALDAATKAGLGWPPMLAESEKALTAIGLKAIESEKRLVALPVDKMRESISLTETARGQMEVGKFTEAGDSLKTASNLWSGNELASRLNVELSAAKAKVAVAPVNPPPPAASTPRLPITPRSIPVPPAAGASAGASASAPAAPADAEEPSGGFFTRPAGIVVLIVTIVVVLGAVTVYRKMAARANEPQQ